jgi:hypothetical protein
MRTIRVKIEVDVEVGDDFDVQDIAVGKYVSSSNAEKLLMVDDDFRVVDYHKISAE